MNLIGDPWIPVLDTDGKPRQVGLRELYERAHTLRDLSATPPQRIALIRLLICITQAALDGPANEREWYDCRDRIVPESLRYLDARLNRFELYGDRPFLQVPTLEPKRNAVCDKLDFGLAAGNNTTLYDQSAGPGGRSHDAGWLALMLITFQSFSPGGLIGTNNWNGDDTGKTSEHAPCIEGSPLHLIIRGATLLDALHMNLLTREQVASLPNALWGQPVWDSMPTRPGALAGEAHSLGYLARLVPVPRAIHLDPDSEAFTLAAGVAYTKLPGYREPSTTIVVRGKGAKQRLSHLNINLDKHPWRELGAVLALNSDGAGGPRVLDHLRSLAADEQEIDIWTGGLAADKGKILDVAEWSFAIPLSMLQDHALNVYRQGVQLAEDGAGRLLKAISSYCAYLQMSNSLAPRARAFYWGQMDQAYPVLIAAVNASDGAISETWKPVVQRTVTAAFADTCPRSTPRQIQAYALAQRHLRLKP